MKFADWGLGSGANTGRSLPRTRNNQTMKITSILSTAISAAVFVTAQSEAAIYVKIPTVAGDVSSSGYDNAITIQIDAYTHKLSRNRKTGEIQESFQVDRETDETSVRLVESFLGGRPVVVLLEDGRKVEAQIHSYSRTTDKDGDESETFSFGVEREMKESGEKGGTEPVETSSEDGDDLLIVNNGDGSDFRGDANLDGRVDANDLSSQARGMLSQIQAGNGGSSAPANPKPKPKPKPKPRPSGDGLGSILPLLL